MKMEYFNPFCTATSEVFKFMFDIDPAKGDFSIECLSITNQDVLVELELVGGLKGRVIMKIPVDMCLELIKNMAGIEVDEIDSFASSALGEMLNIIGGNAVSALSTSDFLCDIKLPKVSLGENIKMESMAEKFMLVPFSTSNGQFYLGISAVE